MPEHKGQLVRCSICGDGPYDTLDDACIRYEDDRYICSNCMLAYMEGKRIGLLEALAEMKKEGTNG